MTGHYIGNWVRRDKGGRTAGGVGSAAKEKVTGRRHYLSSDEIKEAEFQILLKFAAFCEKHELNYFLCGGTCLGAVRHKGFIPWDDDIDMMMPRPDFERFIELAREEAPFAFGHVRLGTQAHPFIKIFDTDITIEKEYSKATGVDHLWIDVLPLDALPDDVEKMKKLYRSIYYLRRMLLIADSKFGRGTSLSHLVIKTLLTPLAKGVGAQGWGRKIDKKARSYDYASCRGFGVAVWGYGPGEYMDKAECLKAVPMEFEGHMFPAPGCYDSYLTGIYGDYMTPPPIEKRVTHEIRAYRIVREDEISADGGKSGDDGAGEASRGTDGDGVRQ